VDDPLPTIAANIRATREALGISQEEGAARCGLHRNDYGLIERGKREPGVRKLVRIAHGLGAPPTDFLQGVG
jgi:transcriptional regulator with XRE-family HTH domain